MRIPGVNRIALPLLALFLLPLAADVAPAPGASPFVATAAAQEASESGTTATLAGRVMSAMTGGPLEGAQVILTRSGRGTTTNERGRFRIADAPAGADTVRVRLIGFADERVPLTLRAGTTTEVTFLLSETVLRMEEIDVVVESSVSSRLEAFERRRERGLGLFLTPEDIENRNARQASDYLRNQPGLRVTRSVLGKSEILLNRSNLNCNPAILVDGTKLHDFSIDDLNPEDVRAIEIYRGSSEVPPDLTMQFDGCGLIVVWTREGGAGPRR